MQAVLTKRQRVTQVLVHCGRKRQIPSDLLSARRKACNAGGAAPLLSLNGETDAKGVMQPSTLCRSWERDSKRQAGRRR